MIGDTLVVDVIIPARDVEAILPSVLRAIPRPLVREVVVVDNGSRDATIRAAVENGARLLAEPSLGEGRACLRGLQYVTAQTRPPDVVAFLSGDGSDDARDLSLVLAPLRAGAADFVVGVRDRACPVGGRAAGLLVGVVYGQRYSDVSPFCAIRLPALVSLGLHEPDWGWRTEMQLKAAKARLRVVEVPVHARPAPRRPLGERVRAALGRTWKTAYLVVRHATVR
jgi:glycosyltransferase involved in cell wall biosynthesis